MLILSTICVECLSFGSSAFNKILLCVRVSACQITFYLFNTKCRVIRFCLCLRNSFGFEMEGGCVISFRLKFCLKDETDMNKYLSICEK